MLELTKDTVETVNELSQALNMGGLRIFRRRFDDELVLAAALVDGPIAGDAIVEDGGAHVYLDSSTAAALANKTLDARIADGQVHLSVLERS